jgi:hypothetical protein
MRYALLAGTVLAPATPAFADQSAQNFSAASKQTSLAVGAIGESGLKATSGVVAVPLGGVALASGAVGVGAAASGQYEIAKGFSDASAAITKDARELVEFSNSPLAITDEVVVKKPQPAPQVPFTPAGQR